MAPKGLSRKSSPSALPDEQWAIVAPLLPPAKSGPRGGHPRQVDRRAVLKTLVYLNRSGCQWDRLPQALLPTSTVSDAFAPWRDAGPWAKLVKAWRERTRVAAGREPRPRAACIASPSVKTTEMGGPERGDDGGKPSTGRTRHLGVDTLGVLLAVLLTSAGLDEGVAAPLLLSPVPAHALPRLVTIWADTKYHTPTLAAWLAVHRAGWHLAVKTGPEGTNGFTPVETR